MVCVFSPGGCHAVDFSASWRLGLSEQPGGAGHLFLWKRCKRHRAQLLNFSGHRKDAHKCSEQAGAIEEDIEIIAKTYESRSNPRCPAYFAGNGAAAQAFAETGAAFRFLYCYMTPRSAV